MSGDGRYAQAACERFEALELKAADGAPRTAEEQGFMRAHGSACEVCGALAGALDAVRFEDDACGALGVDELATRRLVNGALEALAREVTEEPEQGPTAATPATRRVPRHPRFGLRGVGLSAGVAAATALVVAIVALYSRADPDRLVLTAPHDPGGSDLAGHGVSLVLVSGDVRTPRGAVSLGEVLAPAEELRVGRGRAALRIGADVSALLSPHTTLRVTAAPGVERQLHLVAGEVTVAVQPRRGARGLVVRVADVRVAVTGTVFSVGNGAQGAQVAVLRGAVRVTAARQAPLRVGRSRGYVVGARRAELLDPARERILWQRARVLDLLRADRPARLSLRTDPAGAEVRVDGTLLGVTPLDAALGEGQHDLELRLSDHTPVLERVALRSVGTHERDYCFVRERPRPVTPTDRPRPMDPMGEPRAEGWRAVLRAARAKRAARDWPGAAQAYRELIRRYPRQGAARAALVSLGFIQLEHLRRPAVALATFRRYLAGGPGDALAREAAWGEILALGALGRRGVERRALQRFVARYPRSVYRRRAARRLQKLTP